MTVNAVLRTQTQQLQSLIHSMQPLVRGYEVHLEALRRMLKKEEGERKVMRAMELRAKQKVNDVKRLRVCESVSNDHKAILCDLRQSRRVHALMNAQDRIENHLQDTESIDLVQEIKRLHSRHVVLRVSFNTLILLLLHLNNYTHN